MHSQKDILIVEIPQQGALQQQQLVQPLVIPAAAIDVKDRALCTGVAGADAVQDYLASRVQFTTTNSKRTAHCARGPSNYV